MWPTGRIVTRLFGPRLQPAGPARRRQNARAHRGRGAVIAGERMTRLRGRTDGWTGRRGRGRTDRRAHAKIISSSWCSNGYIAANGAAGGEEQSWRMEREREMQKCRSCRGSSPPPQPLLLLFGEGKKELTRRSCPRRRRRGGELEMGRKRRDWREKYKRTWELQDASILFGKMAPPRRRRRLPPG